MDSELKNMLVQLLEGQTRIESEVKKNSIKLEDLEKNIAIIAEVQTAHKEQSITCFDKLTNSISDDTNLLEHAVKSVSKDTKEIKSELEVLKEMTGKHEVDINILKRRPV
ncbi:hypothetical protein KYB31_22475 [Clostridium felsineum]|uniref:hypothetical protein n=1 Tax=Clostridium felsineum TaxID=36839 RepID=UPI00214DD665|nr:hypothetical protein [Clostridium felsineum]MCR3761742.1 hypothetical protein [Clostridium felsineum]